MTQETYANNFVTTLSGNGGSISSGATSIILASGTGAPSGQSRFVIGTEIIIGSISGTTLTATTRGAESTTAAAHNDGSQVSCVLTAASLLASPGVTTTTGDIEYMASGGPARLAIGANTYALISNGTIPGWAAIPSSTPLDNETQAGILINATSTGDAGNRADHFTGSSLSGSWTRAGLAPDVQVVSNSMLSLSSSGSFARTTYQRAYTPSGAFTLECRVIGGNSGDGADGYFHLYVGDTANQGGNWQGIVYKNGSIGGAGSGGSSTAVPAADIPALSPVYLRIHFDGANTWTPSYSRDRNYWFTTQAKTGVTFTPVFLGIRVSDQTTYIGIDFVDVTL